MAFAVRKSQTGDGCSVAVTSTMGGASFECAPVHLPVALAYCVGYSPDRIVD